MIRHDHVFKVLDHQTIMEDNFEFESPAGIVGVIFNKLVLEKYLRNLLIKRNQMIKDVAESDQWKKILNT
jgi:ligand-binding SRPBCC domain-containing protein